MPIAHPVASLENPALAPYLTLRRPEGHDRAGIFVAEGPKVIERVLAAGLVIESMLCTEPWRAHFTPRLTGQSPDLPIYVTDEANLRQLIGFHLFNGVLAVTRIPAAPTVATLLARPDRPRLWIALDGLTNAENLGTITRSAVALGAEAILCGETCTSPWLRRTVRTSMGAMVAVPVVRSPDLEADLTALSRAGVACWAADAHGGIPLPTAPLASDLCLVLGSEGHGLRPAIAAACPHALTIPMPGGLDSLNVAAAAAIVLYEIARQRAAAKSPHP